MKERLSDTMEVVSTTTETTFVIRLVEDQVGARPVGVQLEDVRAGVMHTLSRKLEKLGKLAREIHVKVTIYSD